MSAAKNVMGQPLQTCSEDPMTGFYRNGCCDTGAGDMGVHVVCARMTAEFLAFTRDRGNDLTAPNPTMGFAGLKPDDQWCLCATRWREAMDAGVAPPVKLAATHIAVLEFIDLDDLKRHALDADESTA